MNSFRCRETGILGGRSLCVAREALYVHSSAISESERVTARLHEPSRIERRSTLPNRDHFMKCVQQPLARLAADQSRALPVASDTLLMEALSFWRRLSHMQLGLSDHVREAVSAGHQTVMEIAIQQGHLDVAKMAADQHVAIDLSPGTAPNLYSQLIQNCCSTKTVSPQNVSFALSVLSEVKAHGLLLDQKSWESVISSQVQLGDAQAAVSTLHSMKSAGYTPTRELYEAVLVAIMALDDNLTKSQLGEDIVQKFFSDYESLDIDGFHLLLQYVRDRNQLEVIIIQMKAAGVKMIPKTWALLMDAVFRVSPFVSHWSKAFSVPAWPSVEWAIELLIDQSEDSALNVGSEACEKVLVTCCQHSMLDRAMEVYDFMRNACHTTLSPQGYMLLLRQIDRSASSRNMAPAFRIWEDLLELYDGAPPAWVYHAMMLPLSKHLKMRGVKYIRSVMLNQAKKEGYFQPRPSVVDNQQLHWAWSQDMYHSLIKACASAGSPKASWQYYREMEIYWKPNSDTFANLLLIVKRKEQLERYGLSLFSEMICSQVDQVQLLRHPLLLMCGRIQSRDGLGVRPNSSLLNSTGILCLAHHLVAELEDRPASVRGVVRSSVINALLRFIEEEVKASVNADSMIGVNDQDERFEASNCFGDENYYLPYSSVRNCSSKLRDISKQITL